MRKKFYYSTLLAASLMLLTACSMHTYHFGVQNRAAMVPDDFGETEAALAQAERSEGAKYCPDKLEKARQLAHDGAEVYWSCHNTESSDLLAQARKLAKEVEACGPKAAAAVPAPSPPPAPAPEAGKLTKVCIPLNIQFEIDSATILPDYDLDIEKVADFMRRNPTTTAEIEGHTDNVGTAEHNLKLSQRRAESVVKRLEEKYGIESSRLSAVGYGMTRPIADNSTDEGRQKNRRIDAVISCALEKNFVPPPSKICISLMIDFATDSVTIKPEYESQLTKVADFMKEYPETTAVIEGHTDDVGGTKYNMELSKRRAESVLQKLVEDGIDKSRLTAEGFGDTRKLDYNSSPEGRKKNRRVEIWVDCVLVRK